MIEQGLALVSLLSFALKTALLESIFFCLQIHVTIAFDTLAEAIAVIHIFDAIALKSSFGLFCLRDGIALLVENNLIASLEMSFRFDLFKLTLGERGKYLHCCGRVFSLEFKEPLSIIFYTVESRFFSG